MSDLKFKEGDVVVATFATTLGQPGEYDGKIVRQSEKDGHWAVNIGWLVVHLPEQDIRHV